MNPDTVTLVSREGNPSDSSPSSSSSVVTVEYELCELSLLPALHAPSLTLRQCASLHNGTVVGCNHDRTGLFVWPGAKKFCQFLAQLCIADRGGEGDQEQLQSTSYFSFSNLCSGLIELGGGIGVGALAAAVLWRNMECWTTDYWPPALDLAMQQRAPNATALAKSNSTFSAGLVDWLWWEPDRRGATEEPTTSLDSHDNDNDNHHPWKRFSQSTFIEHVAKPPPPPPLLQAAGRSGANKVPWLVGLDVVYPDTRDSILSSLLKCVRAVLVARLAHHAEASASVSPSSPYEYFTTVFVERDPGVTLRRILIAASSIGLEVVPVASPFHSDSAWISQSVQYYHDTSYVSGEDRRRRVDGCWTWLHQKIVSCIADGTLPLKVCGVGCWMLEFRLASSMPPPPPVSEMKQSGDGCSAVTSTNGRWVSLLPWLWSNEPSVATTTMPSTAVESVCGRARRCRLRTALPTSGTDDENSIEDVRLLPSYYLDDLLKESGDGNGDEMMLPFCDTSSDEEEKE